MSKKNRKEKSRPVVSGLFLITLGITWLMVMYGTIEPEDAWPVVLIFFGVVLVARAFRRKTGEPAQQAPDPHQQP